MNNKRVIILFFVLLTLFTACSIQKGTEESRIVSADELKKGVKQLRLYVFDGEKTTWYYLPDQEKEEAVVQEFANIPCYKDPSVSYPLSSFPWYGLDIQFADDTSQNKYFAINSGAAVIVSELWEAERMKIKEEMTGRVDDNVENLLKGYEWKEISQEEKAGSFPAASQLLKTENGWCTEYLKEAERVEMQEELTIEISQDSDNKLIAKTMYTGDDPDGAALDSLGIGILHVENQGKWYTVPYNHSPTFFSPGAYGVVLQKGQIHESILDLDGYFGTLPPGHYRWCMLLDGSLYKEFNIGKNNKLE